MTQTTPYPSSSNAAYARFLHAYPTYASTGALDDLRAREYARLDATGQVYLDYTGGGLYAERQLREHLELLSHNVFGNPHSHNPTSQAMTCLVDQARAYVLEFFNAPPGEYVAIFTQNASAALKLVGEAYPFGPGDHYLLTFDNHNSVNGIRGVRHGSRARNSLICRSSNPSCGSIPRRWTNTWRWPGPARTTCSRFRPNPTSAASSTRWR